MQTALDHDEAFALTAKQNEAIKLFAGDAGIILLYGGARSTKTFTIVRNIVTRALIAPKSRHAVLRFRFSHVKASVIYDTFPKVMELCFPGIPYKLNKSDWFATLPNDSEIWFGGLDDKERTEKILGNEYCLDPESMVLMADLSWRRAEDVSKGDEIVAFPEDLDGYLKLKRAVVEFNKLLPDKQRYRVVTDKGSTIVSEGHRFVLRHDDRRVRNARTNSWCHVEDLNPGDRMKFGAAPWTRDQSYAGGWLAGIFDGEGWLSVGAQTGVSQAPGVVLDKIKATFTSRGIQFREHLTENGGKNCVQVMPKGMWASMKAIGSLRPVRLMDRAHMLWEGRHGFHDRTGDDMHNAEVLSIEELPRGDVRGIQTSSKTLITDGFLSHNCTIFLNECSQISHESFLLMQTRLAQKCHYIRDGKRHEMRLKLICDENPPLRGHWTYKLFIHGLDPQTNRPIKNPEDYAFLQMNPADNVENLPASYIKMLDGMPKRQRDRFWLGLFGSASEGALWSAQTIEQSIVSEGPERFQRIVIAVDPSGATGEPETTNDDIGIVVCGLGLDGIAYVLEDLTVNAAPAIWGGVVSSAYKRHEADRVIGEINYGGAMVEYVIRAADPNISFKSIHASRSKMLRAEPVSALHEQGKIKLVGNFPDLEDELSNATTTGYTGSRSPNRLDAFVFAVTELFPGVVRPKAEKKPLVIPNLQRLRRAG